MSPGVAKYVTESSLERKIFSKNPMEQDILLSCSRHLTNIYFHEDPTALD